jgi:hypothetical protein
MATGKIVFKEESYLRLLVNFGHYPKIEHERFVSQFFTTKSTKDTKREMASSASFSDPFVLFVSFVVNFDRRANQEGQGPGVSDRQRARRGDGRY